MMYSLGILHNGNSVTDISWKIPHRECRFPVTYRHAVLTACARERHISVSSYNPDSVSPTKTCQHIVEYHRTSRRIPAHGRLSHTVSADSLLPGLSLRRKYDQRPVHGRSATLQSFRTL